MFIGLSFWSSSTSNSHIIKTLIKFNSIELVVLAQKYCFNMGLYIFYNGNEKN